jgi:hypothetical protein
MLQKDTQVQEDKVCMMKGLRLRGQRGMLYDSNLLIIQTLSFQT